MKSLFDQTLTVQAAGESDDDAAAPLAAIVAPADPTTITALARENVTVAMLAYTEVDPQVAVGDTLTVGTTSYTVVAPTRPYVSATLGMSVFVTPCGPANG
jgi:hypothetical protein